MPSIDKELEHHNIIIKNNNLCLYKNKDRTFYDCISFLYDEIDQYINIIESSIEKVCEVINRVEVNTYIQTESLDVLFPNALNNLRMLCSYFEGSEEDKKKIDSAMSMDINTFSILDKVFIIDASMATDWAFHLINKNRYLASLLKYRSNAVKNKKEVIARGVDGPFSRLDLPMRERAFEWSDIAEEVAGRERDKRRQSRYTLGLKNDGHRVPNFKDPKKRKKNKRKGSGMNVDHYPNEGFYWREMKNEPFAWTDQDKNPYPHRNLLWE